MEFKGAHLAFPGSAGRIQVVPAAQAFYLSASLTVFGEVLLALVHVGLDCAAAWLPASGTDFPMLRDVLEGLDQPQGFVHGAHHRQIIDSHLVRGTLAIHDKDAPIGNAFILL